MDDGAPSKLGSHTGRDARVHNINRKPGGGTSRAYILARLEREGRRDPIAGIKARQISCYAAAVEMG
jgi:hypothetical protein